MTKENDYCQYWKDDAEGKEPDYTPCGICSDCLEWQEVHNEKWLY